MKSLERSPHHYYDRPSIWADNYWNDMQQNRAKTTVELLPTGIRSVLDIGCGAGIITKALEPLIPEIIAIDFALSPLIQVKKSHAQVVLGNACFLPFEDKSFDAVVATELIEHLSESDRKQALSEMERVSRKIILLTVPWREVLEYEQVKCGNCGCIFHASYHTKSFDKSEMSFLFKGLFDITKVKLFGPVKKRIPRSMVMLAQIFGGYARLEPGRSLCPQCGNIGHFVWHRNILTQLFLDIPSRMLPFPKKPSWMAVLYERNSQDRKYDGG